MLDFKDKLEKTIVDNFIKYNVDPNPISDGKIVVFDPETQIHYINSVASASNLNVVVSKNLVSKQQHDKALEIINIFQNNKMPFTWCVVSNSKAAKEKDFFAEQGFIYSETLTAMMLDLNEFNDQIPLNENEKIKEVQTIEDVEKFRQIIKSAFSLVLIDLQKYYGLYEMSKTKKINYQIFLSVDDVPASSGQFYFDENLIMIDDIATAPDFQKKGLAKKMLNHLLNTGKARGFTQAALIATPEGFDLYQKLGFRPINLYFDVYEINY